MGDNENEVSVNALMNVEWNIIRRDKMLLHNSCRLLMDDIFIFQIGIRDTIRVYKYCNETRRVMLHSLELKRPHFSQKFVVPFETITPNNKNRAKRTIHMMLGEAGVSRARRRPMLGKIYAEAMRLANERARPSSDDDDGEYKKIPILVDIARVYAKVIFEVDDRRRPVPARLSAIEALEKVRVDNEMEEVCAVCLEEMEVEMEVSRMPCKHMFHRSCIAAWLSKANMCPICRFQLS